MTVHVDVWLRGDDFATTQAIEGSTRQTQDWVDEDVQRILEGMLQAMHRLKHPQDGAPPVFLRGLSWIVNTYDEGGVVIAIEIAMGAAVAGPFVIDKHALETMIERVLGRPVQPPSDTIH